MQKGWCKIKSTYQSSTIYEYRKKALNYECFFSSQFNYCSLTYMSHNGLLNRKIDFMKDVFVLFIKKVIRPIRSITDFSNRNVEGIHWSATDILNEVLPLKPLSNYN